jgi:CheY-like chemotaxis protein
MKQALVVDDEHFNREIICLYLEALFYQVTQVENGKEALLKIKASPEKFHLITMDYNMPGMNGVETIQQIRAYNAHVPVIGISAAAPVMAQQLKNAAHIRVLSKPLDKTELEKTIRELESA